MSLTFDPLGGALTRLLQHGGAVSALLLGLSVVVLAVTLWKLWQYHSLGVGRHRRLSEAVALWDRGDRAGALAQLERSRSHFAPVVQRGVRALLAGAPGDRLGDRLETEMAVGLARLEGGFRLLDAAAQLAPLLGLFGTVVGMIQAFAALQAAGSNVDPAVLAGGIWVALLNTALGLAVAMPSTLVLVWLESRVARERVAGDRILQTLLAPEVAEARPAPALPRRAAHAG